MSDYWQPRSFQPGDRVRVRLSPECRFCWPMRVNRGFNYDGMTGVVINDQSFGRPIILNTVRNIGHGIIVVPDRSWYDQGTDDRGAAIFAPIELERLEESCSE